MKHWPNVTAAESGPKEWVWGVSEQLRMTSVPVSLGNSRGKVSAHCLGDVVLIRSLGEILVAKCTWPSDPLLSGLEAS